MKLFLYCFFDRSGTATGRKKTKESTQSRPVIARFTCRQDRDKVWKQKYRLKELNSRIIISDDVPPKVREERRRFLIPALKKIKQEEKGKKSPRKVTVIGDKLIVDGKAYKATQIPKKWFADEEEIMEEG